MSFHAIPSLTGKSYGQLDCDRDVVDGIKKGLNGGLVWGVRVRFEDARPGTFIPGGVLNEEVERVETRESMRRRTVIVIERRLKKARRRM